VPEIACLKLTGRLVNVMTKTMWGNLLVFVNLCCMLATMSIKLIPVKMA